MTYETTEAPTPYRATGIFRHLQRDPRRPVADLTEMHETTARISFSKEIHMGNRDKQRKEPKKPKKPKPAP